MNRRVNEVPALHDVTVVDRDGSRYEARLEALNSWHAVARMTGYLGVRGVRMRAIKAPRKEAQHA